ncbi:MAG: TIGR01777 family oxidoreductase [Thermodesulfobacteriota bacterium]
MKVFMTGGTGFVGSSLSAALAGGGHEVTILTRSSPGGRVYPRRVSLLTGDPTAPGEWQKAVPEHHVIINLAGTSIFRRWSASSKQAMRESRLSTTRNLVQAISQRKGLVRQLMSASAIGYYGFREEGDLDEESPPGEGFLAELSRECESAARQAEAFDVKATLLRFGVVLGRHGGALQKMIPPFRWYLGSPLGSGKQWFSWIHEQDLAGSFLFLLRRGEVSGPFNCTAPNPVRNEEMTRILGEALGKPTFMPAVPSFLLRLLLGEFATVVVKGQKVIPKRLTNLGFQFRFGDLRSALEDLLA